MNTCRKGKNTDFKIYQIFDFHKFQNKKYEEYNREKQMTCEIIEETPAEYILTSPLVTDSYQSISQNIRDESYLLHNIYIAVN